MTAELRTQPERTDVSLSVRRYLKCARTFAQASSLPVWRALLNMLSVRYRYHIGAYYYCYFCVDGKPPRDWSAYILNGHFEPVQRRLSPPAARMWAMDKYRFYERCAQAGLPVPRVWGVIADTRTDPSHSAPRLHDASAWQALMRESGLDEFFLKPSHGLHGGGAFVARMVEDRVHFADREGSCDDLVHYALEQLPAGNSYLVQSRLRNGKSIAPMMSTEGLGTVRLVTTLIAGDYHEIGACLRLTAGSAVTDNFNLGLSNNVVAPVELASGILGEGVRSVGEGWPDMRSVRLHPGNGNLIPGFALPQWQEVRALARRAHATFPELGSVGWDICFTDQGPVIIEANHLWSVNLLQLAHRRGLRPHLENIMGPLTEAHAS